MKILADILKGFEILKTDGNIEIEIDGLTLDSRQVKPGFLFIALKGINTDGHQFIDKAVENGAVAVVYTESCNFASNVTFVKVKDNLQGVAARLAHNFYDTPSEKLKVIGVTGTNGKTTIATSLYNLFNNLGYKSGLISTVANFIGQERFETKLTTPDPVQLQYLFSKMVENNCQFCFMEVSSHAAHQHRIDCIDFDFAIFTNLTQDHLDYHKTLANYRDAKKMFFDNLKSTAVALTNIDDKNGSYMVQNFKNHKSYSLKTIADFRAKIIERHFDSTLAEIDGTGVWLQFVGSFNVYNLLAVYATAISMLDVNKNELLNAISALKPVTGRFEIVKENDIVAIIDYAHTPDALENTLKELHDIKTENQRIITVVGAGGDRDKGKRPKMAAIAKFYSDVLILTSDNPRSEEPEAIINDMIAGLQKDDKFFKITDRLEAIKLAVEFANKNDIVFIAGKGHETYQEIKGVRHHFDDKEEAYKQLKMKKL